MSAVRQLASRAFSRSVQPAASIAQPAADAIRACGAASHGRPLVTRHRRAARPSHVACAGARLPKGFAPRLGLVLGSGMGGIAGAPSRTVGSRTLALLVPRWGAAAVAACRPSMCAARSNATFVLREARSQTRSRARLLSHTRTSPGFRALLCTVRAAQGRGALARAGVPCTRVSPPGHPRRARGAARVRHTAGRRGRVLPGPRAHVRTGDGPLCCMDAEQEYLHVT